MSSQSYDVLVIGGGPAGLAAGMYAARAKARVLLLERGMPGGALLLTKEIENYPGVGCVDGFTLAERMAEQTREAGCPIEMATVTAIRPMPIVGPTAPAAAPRWQVETDDGRRFEAPIVILAAGGAPVKLGVPGEAEYNGRGVSYCAVCDCRFHQDGIVGVVGGGDAALEESTLLAQYAREVLIIHRRDTFRASAVLQERVRATPNITILPDTIVTRVEGDDASVRRLILRSTRRAEGTYDFAGVGPERALDATGLFPFLGFTPNAHLVAGGHAAHDAAGHFLTDASCETSLPGLFAVGDVRAQPIRQVTTAVADGTIAAIIATRRLHEGTRGDDALTH